MSQRYFDTVLSTTGSPRVRLVFPGTRLIGGWITAGGPCVNRHYENASWGQRRWVCLGLQTGKAPFVVVPFSILVGTEKCKDLCFKFENDLALTTSTTSFFFPGGSCAWCTFYNCESFIACSAWLCCWRRKLVCRVSHYLVNFPWHHTCASTIYPLIEVSCWLFFQEKYQGRDIITYLQEVSNY